ncbi:MULTISPECIES: phenylalanine--tRNA ligase subunit beta [unclassified Sphingomonas]|uniref:phenylalanine--tRNA ligase subunit beta n=1 Tax=unclassified Sphingomonas TaxID=196159 RepID=UPI0006FF8D81|nr:MULTISPECIES: phenylalanine--tRNA ligase subunit beta [unclassified Sphingomonas]KQM26632.1 phenylalanine--tRNA ligase subunit beta [Sphingomonas sp. Leaf9]KQM43038.1 phenylalanine--tRNA ligase subunit beta [Sphingomonas sp. Leaf11]
MKFTLSWLHEHLDTDASLDTILGALNAIGLEVEGVEDPGEKLAAFRVARVLSAEPHPQADKLQVLSVDAGDGPLQVVCGAPNARAGLVGVFGMPGATVPANGMVLKVAAIRGVESNGMMCSTRELELGEDHDGIIELPADAPVGTAFPAYAGLDDPVIDISVTPNRQDCMGVRGIARDLAAAGYGTLKPLAVPAVAGEGAGPDVRVEDAAGCPAFYAQAVRGLTNGESPEWMRRRLNAIGQKPISTLVDITNYVMFDLGRPLHVYDMAKLDGGLVARVAIPGESVVVLNGKAYTLSGGETVIADAGAVHDIGGIMGGEHSGVSDTTTDVLIECAYFTPEAITRTGQKLALTSDARTRFERGVDPAFVEQGLAIATDYVLRLCGGQASGVTRAGTPPTEARTIIHQPGRVATLGGLDVAEDRQRAILERLGFIVGDNWQVTVPTWRRDVEGTADLVEEVIRIEGLDKVPSTPLDRPAGVAVPTATPEQKLERRMRRAAAARGLAEAITWSFIADDEAAPFGGGAWEVVNPIASNMRVMRPSLLPGLLSAAARNAKRGQSSVRLFEIGRRYLAEGERATLGVVLAGERAPRNWRTGKAQGFDAFDAKAEVLALLEAAGAPVGNLQVMDGAGDVFHPGQSATLRLGPKTVLASFGVLHPTTAKAFDLGGGVVAAEIYLDALPAKRGQGFMRAAYAPPSLQGVTRDFAFLVADDVTGDQLVRAVRGADKAAIVDARLFDVFAGQGVEPGHKSLAIEVTLQPGAKSFTDVELKAISDKIVAAAKKIGGSLRA